MLKVLLVRSQKEIRNTLLDNGRKVILVLSSRKLGSTVLYYRVESRICKSDELGYLAEAISKQKVKGVAWFLLGIYRKM